MQIAQHEYWAEIEALAKSVTEESREYDCEIADVLHEAIDGHQWGVYTAYHCAVIWYTSADLDAIYEELRELAQTWDQLLTMMTVHAMVCDVMEHSAFDAEPEGDDDE